MYQGEVLLVPYIIGSREGELWDMLPQERKNIGSKEPADGNTERIKF